MEPPETNELTLNVIICMLSREFVMNTNKTLLMAWANLSLSQLPYTILNKENNNRYPILITDSRSRNERRAKTARATGNPFG